jgi:hypothetical protein
MMVLGDLRNSVILVLAVVSGGRRVCSGDVINWGYTGYILYIVGITDWITFMCLCHRRDRLRWSLYASGSVVERKRKLSAGWVHQGRAISYRKGRAR